MVSSMNVISKKPFNDAAIKYPNDKVALLEMFSVLQKTDFTTPQEMKAVFPSLDNFKYKNKCWVLDAGCWMLDVGGRNLRVLAFVQFVNKRMYIKHIVNHADYDKLTDKYRKEKKE